jgi:hypothetical protein
LNNAYLKYQCPRIIFYFLQTILTIEAERAQAIVVHIGEFGAVIGQVFQSLRIAGIVNGVKRKQNKKF